MRRPRYLDFVCPSCEGKHTRFVETEDDDTPIGEPEICGADLYGNYQVEECGGVLVKVETEFRGYMKMITKGNHDYNDRERERLEKRGDEHWKKHGKDEAVDRERALFKKHGMEGVGGVK